MGVLTDYVVASAEEAIAGLQSIPDNTEDRVEVRGTSPVSIIDLKRILLENRSVEPRPVARMTWADVVAGRVVKDRNADQLPLVFEEGPGGPWVYQLPSELVSRLSATDEPALTEIATRWWQCVEFQREPPYRSWDVSAVRQFLTILVTLARRARENGKNLYLWMCC